MNIVIKPYVPIVRWRPAEMGALERLFPQDWKNVTPFIEFIMPAPSLDKDTRDVIKTPKDKFLQTLPDVAEDMLKSCGQNPIFVDVHLLDADVRASSFKQILSSLKELNLFPIPVTYIIPVTSTDADMETRTVATNYAKTSGHGLCIRINKSHFKEKDLSSQITDFIKANNLKEEEIDLLIDLRVIDETTSATDTVNLLTRLPDLQKWRSFVVSGGAFPKDLSNFAAGTVHSLDRLEWKLWNALRGIRLPRFPLFSDYTIQHPIYERIDAIGSASIRYTDDEQWWIFRGKKPGLIDRRTKIKGPGREQYIGHAQTLVRRNFYKGKDYSFGDTEINRIAAPGNKKPGSPTTWLTTSINHHITLVGRQIASLAENTAKRPVRILSTADVR